jgi:hypothetical protein
VSFVHTAQYRAHPFSKSQGVVPQAHNKSLQFAAVSGPRQYLPSGCRKKPVSFIAGACRAQTSPASPKLGLVQVPFSRSRISINNCS